MSASITKQITSAVVTLLRTGAPSGVSVDKSRKAAYGENELPRYSVYLIHEQPKAIGNPRAPALMMRNLTLEIRLTAAGTDDDADDHRVWVVSQMGNAGRLGGLVKNISESETAWDMAEGTDSEFTVCTVRYVIEYGTDPIDLTKVA